MPLDGQSFYFACFWIPKPPNRGGIPNRSFQRPANLADATRMVKPSDSKFLDAQTSNSKVLISWGHAPG